MNSQQQKHKYVSPEGKRLPSVTTILSRFKDSGGLLHWANSQGLAGITLAEARQAAVTPGTIAHALVEAELNGTTYVPVADEESMIKAQMAFSAYQAWRKTSQIEFRHTEVPLASAKYKFGGTLDAIGSMNGQLVLCDWKNAVAIYADNLYQLAAYGILWEENYSDHPLTGGYHLLRFSKDTGDFSHHHYASLEDEKVIFLKMRELYDLVKQTEKRVK